MKQRGFEIVSYYQEKNIILPSRKTKFSAGYDIATAENIILLPQQVTLIPTGIKAYMQTDEYLGVHIRSSIAIKQKLTLINNVGVIDADYYNNVENEGHIMIPVYNYNQSSVTIEKDTRIAQGIFYRYLLASDDKAENIRIGGIGSTGKI
ncbi:MAG: dUTP diphosphatase [Negativicutes bacterium]|nr:dUTP diphosphatase [Negativicutes bacterium]MBP9537418.1 dUTP diphosphatase [Negativicutes bacterium]MBP9948729.1 dUTP diphosphatase [Negativicutes bacterium]